MDTQVEREILAAHADQLNAGLRGPAAYPPMTGGQQHTLTPFLLLAELLSEVLVLVEPSPTFVQRLGHELAWQPRGVNCHSWSGIARGS